MLFNSYIFLFLFLPLAFAGFWGLQRFGQKQLAFTFLLLASLSFYSYWNPPYVLLLIGSIVFNYLIGNALIRENTWRRFFMVTGVGGNILLLSYFKYSGFGIEIFNQLSHSRFKTLDLFLPLGISFFTFQQIVYLCDIYYKKIEPAKLRDYALFVSFFPHLLAGPITQPREILPQIQNHTGREKFWDNLAIGLSLFIIGLFKKVIIADKLATYASPVFDNALKGKEILFFDGWAGALGYTFQLYFDFSGYSDMALGLGLMFGIAMPINFLSPYKATSIIDFWRRWHMTMSRFFRDYIYIPLGGSRVNGGRQLLNLFITMALAGLWHGAGWTFIAWGVLHGCYLIVNHLYRAFSASYAPQMITTLWHKIAAHLLTMLAVVIGWVFFRAENFDAAFRILHSMFGFNGITMPEKIAHYLPFVQKDSFIHFSDKGEWHKVIIWAAPSIAASYLFCLLMPSSMEFFGLAQNFEGKKHRLYFKPSRAYAIAFAFLATLAIFNMQRISEFLYFQF